MKATEMVKTTVLKENALIKKYSPLLEKVESVLVADDTMSVTSFDDYKKYTLSRIMENAQNLINKYSEAKALMEAGTFQVSNVPAKNQYLKLTAAVYPQLVAEHVASVQAMEFKDATCYYLGYNYGSDRGKIKAGDNISTIFKTGPDVENWEAAMRYASEDINDEQVVLNATGDAFMLAWTPVIPGSFEMPAAGIRDNGTGGVVNATGDVVGVIDYATGAVELTTAITETSVNYAQNLEYAPANLPLVSMDIKPLFLHAKPKALRTAYSLIGAFDLQQTQGLDAQKLLSNLATDELRCEIDGEVLSNIGNLPASQAAGQVFWNMPVPMGIDIAQHYMSFFFKITEAAQKIKQITNKFEGNRIITGFNGNFVLSTLTNFKATNQNSAGPVVSGTLAGKFTTIFNPYMNENDFTVLYQGTTFDTAYIYGVYMPIVSSQFIMDDTLLGRQGYATEYAQAWVNRNYVVRGRVTHNKA